MARRKKRRSARAPVFGAADPLLDARPRATLDLHGDTAAEAERRTRDFLATQAQMVPGSVVHIITGRGRGRPVLPGAVKRVLQGSGARFVADFDRDLDDGGYMVRLS